MRADRRILLAAAAFFAVLPAFAQTLHDSASLPQTPLTRKQEKRLRELDSRICPGKDAGALTELMALARGPEPQARGAALDLLADFLEKRSASCYGTETIREAFLPGLRAAAEAADLTLKRDAGPVGTFEPMLSFSGDRLSAAVVTWESEHPTRLQWLARRWRGPWPLIAAAVLLVLAYFSAGARKRSRRRSR
jgi:hypothetical protein